MSRETEEALRGRIIDVVRAQLETEGYDAVQLREVARRAHVSLTTIYKHFPTRDELIVSALEAWMAENAYVAMESPLPGESIYDGLMRVIRHVFEPWERHPRMLQAYHRARVGAGAQRLDNHGLDAVLPVAAAVLAGADEIYLQDIAAILSNMAFALLGQCADGTLEVTQALTLIERAVYRLTADNAGDATAAVHRRESLGAGPSTLGPEIAAPFRRSDATD
ncbi:TetR family transcriptional regulator [Nocardia sp. XZ_19_385]|uniref:TetR family transcriptional regulator n=1 Tax=Nocardia sp. XZ_19_385 TaxID=2769488 RepID=UPI00188FD04D|nr:TetR family transcriptional regulator [Nocardia sp. XZ_19_385]